MILLPRGTFKSTIITVGWTLWLLTKDHNLRILITSYKEDNPKGWLSQIKTILCTNPVFRMHYGCWDKDKSSQIWQATAISIPSRSRHLAQPTYMISSVGSSEVSQHFDIVINDDIQTDDNMETKEQIDELENYLQRQIPLLDPQKKTGLPGPRIIVGTHWSFDDVYSRIKARDKTRRKRGETEGFKYLIREAYTTKKGVKTFYFPSRFNDRVLSKIKEESGMSDYLFSCNYLNNPMPEGHEVFSIEDFGFYTEKQRVIGGEISDMPVLMNAFTMIDPAIGETNRSDYSAFVTVRVDSDWNLYLWEVVRERVTPEQSIDQMFRIHQVHQPYRMGFEEAIFQRAILYGFQQACRDRGVWFNIEPLKASTLVSKDQRIRGFQPFIKGRKVFFKINEGVDLTMPPKELYFSVVNGQDYLVDEMVRYPLGAHDDCVDALSYAPQLIFPAGRIPDPPVPTGSYQALVSRMRSKRKKGLLSVG